MRRTKRTISGRIRPFLATALLAAYGGAFGADFIYSGVVTLCSGTCASVDALDLGSSATGTISIDVATGENFTFSDVDATSHVFEIFNPGLPQVLYDGSNWTTANPLPLTADNAVLRESGGKLTTAGDFESGTLLFELVGLLGNNDAWLIFDMGTGVAQICLFFVTAGCIPNATEAVKIDGSFLNLTDTDGDLWLDVEDNCTVTANGSQTDTDVDGFGNICDPDLNNDCIVNFADLNIVKQVFFSDDTDADLNSDGIVNFADLNLVKAKFFGMPGPSLVPNVCAPETIAIETFGDGGTPNNHGWNTGTGTVVADAGDDGAGDHALMYTTQTGFHVLHPVSSSTPNPDFLGNFRFNGATDFVFRARHSGVGDPVVLRVVLFDLFNQVDWAQTVAAVTISNTATTWQTYTLSIREADLVAGGQDGLSMNSIRQSVEQISLRHDPLGTGPQTPSPVTQQTTVFFDDIELSAQGGVYY